MLLLLSLSGEVWGPLLWWNLFLLLVGDTRRNVCTGIGLSSFVACAIIEHWFGNESVAFINHSVQECRYDFCCCAIGWSSSSTNADNLSVVPETPEIMGLPTGVGLCIFVRVYWENWSSRRILCLTKPFFSHFVDMLFSVEFCNQLFYSDGCFFNHGFV